MAGPWEKYAAAAAEPVAGPWMKYQDAAIPVPPIPPETDEALAAEAAAIQVPNTVMPHTGKINPGTLPTTDEARAAVEKWSVPEGPSIMGMVKNTLLGAMDIGQGRVLMNESGNPLSIRPTSESMDALGLAAGMSPAMGSGRAIAQTAEHGAPLAELYARNRQAAPAIAPPAATPLVTALQQGMPAEMQIAAPRPSPLADALARSGQPEADRVFLPSGREVPVQAEALAGSEQRSVGAAGTPSNLTVMPAREAAAAQATGERSQLMETARPGDATEYVPGVTPTLAEIEQNAGVSREAKALRITNPTEIAERAANDAERYADFFGDIAGTPTMANRAKDARAAQAADDLEQAWKAKGAADVQPVLDVAEAIKAGPDGRRRLVRTEIDKVISEMKERDGSLTTDPELLYGARKNLDDLLSKEAQKETPLSARAEAALLSIKAALDDAIEGAAPGFRKYLTNFAEASKPIDVMTLMQKAQLDLFQGANRAVAFHRFDRFMRDLVSDRAAHGVNPAKSIDEATWEKLVAMHKSLQRTAEAERLAKAPGADTAMNLYDMSKLGIRAAAHAVGTLVMPGYGNVAAHLGANYLDTKSAAARLARHLDPDLSKYPQHDSPLARGLTNFPNNTTGP